MARTKQTSRLSTGGHAPRCQLATLTNRLRPNETKTACQMVVVYQRKRLYYIRAAAEWVLSKMREICKPLKETAISSYKSIEMSGLFLKAATQLKNWPSYHRIPNYNIRTAVNKILHRIHQKILVNYEFFSDTGYYLN